MNNILRGKRIFLVEDNAMNRVVFQMSLVASGARTDFERWGQNSVANLQQIGDVDLIILDLMLYDHTSGYDVFTQIRQLPQYEHVPIIAVSATDPSIAIPKTKALGFAGFISKPIDESLFPQQLANILEGEEVWYDGSFPYSDRTTS